MMMVPKNMRQARPQRPGRSFRPAHATALVRRADEGESGPATEAALVEIGVHGLALAANGELDLRSGERITVELAFPELRRRIVAEVRVTALVETGRAPVYRCRFVRIAPWGVRAILSLASAGASRRAG